ncbi:MAG: lipid-binding SYLF domain-containing protein [Parasphingorhabdus sp.]|jgi:lipid-binding SYLF domain-containing protein
MMYTFYCQIKSGKTLLAVFMLVIGNLIGPAHAADDFKQQELVDRASLALDSFNSDEDMQQFRAYVKYAHGIIIVPNLIRGAWLVGAAGGTGVLLVRDQTYGGWSPPAFYSLRSISAGLQVGVSTSEVILLIMTEKGLDLLASNTSVKLGADVSVAAGTAGYSVEAATPMNFSADYVSFARSKGAYMGMGLSGTAIVPKHNWNQAYYNEPVLPSAITAGIVSNSAADGLRQAMAKFFTDNASQ